MPIVLFFVVHWFSSLFFQTFFLHRYSAHSMFTMNRFWEKCFYLGTYFFQGSSYLVPRAYAILHRLHHAYSDTAKDPHSPQIYNNVFMMMMNTKVTYSQLVNKTFLVEPKYEKGIIEWKFLDIIGDSWISRIFWGTCYTLYYLYFASSWWMYLLLPVHFLMGPIHGAIVNWCGHKYGYSNYDNDDESKNTLAADIFLMGELFQNNHHKFPMRINFATRWFEFDPTYIIIRVLFLLKIIRPAKV